MAQETQEPQRTDAELVAEGVVPETEGAEGAERSATLRVETATAVRETATPIELTPEALAECLRGLETDYKRGIVVVDETKGFADFTAALAADKTAGTPWPIIQERLQANEGALLRKAATMQGKGELIGVYPDGTLCIRDRGTEPVIFGTTKDGQQVVITTDTPNREDAMESVSNGGQFADYWEICDAVHRDGFTLPPDAPDYKKRGIVAASEAVTGRYFVRSADGRDWRSAIMECGDVSESASVRVVFFLPRDGRAIVSYDDPTYRGVRRGAVRVLRG